MATMPASEASDSCFPRQFFCPITQEVRVPIHIAPCFVTGITARKLEE